jgi:hypothetical protein
MEERLIQVSLCISKAVDTNKNHEKDRLVPIFFSFFADFQFFVRFRFIVEKNR